MTVDWSFIGSRAIEGTRLAGYVPGLGSSQSGVTIASGVDLGQMNPLSISSLPSDLQQKLSPYLGLKQEAAAAYLRTHPLQVTPPQAALLNALAGQRALAGIRGNYPGFDQLPDAVQTIMASVTYQYGDPWIRCPNFWKACRLKDWTRVVSELRHFGDEYQERHDNEADYLEAHLPAH